MKHLILSAFSDEYSDVLKEQCEALNGFGIGYMELRHADGKNVAEMNDADVARVKSVLSDYGVKVSAIGSPLGKIRIDGDVKGHMDTVRRVCETACELGAKNIRMFSFYYPEEEGAAANRGRIFDALSEMLKISKSYGVTLCHENEAKIYGESPTACREILDYFGGELKAVFDMGNFVLDGFRPYPDAYDLLKKDIAYFHLKDALYAGAIVPAGKGEAQIKEVLSDWSANATEDTFITLEPHLQTFSGLNALVGKPFDNPYKYEDQRAAFTDAVQKIKEILL